MKKCLVVVALLIFCIPSYAENSLEGAFVFAGPVEANGSLSTGKSHIHFEITGDAARVMYASFDGEGIEDGCTGYKHKGKANVSCYEVVPSVKYICGFSINLNKSSTEASQVGAC